MLQGLKLLALSSLLLLTGCAHNILITPPLDNIRNSPSQAKSDLNVGYYISGEDKAKVLTSAGGGGDKVSYTPYKDTEGALVAVLSQVYKKVYAVPSLTDRDFLAQKQITYIFKPQLTATSSSTGTFTWFPTDFALTIICSAVDADGKEIWHEQVTGQGHAEFDEVKNDFPLAAKRASEEAFKKLQKKISESPAVLKK